MKKVYCVIFDYQGYEEQVQGIYAEKAEAIDRLVEEALDCGEDSVEDLMYNGELSLIEWECGSNIRRRVQPRYD